MAPKISPEDSFFLIELELCRMFKALPYPGGLRKQPIRWLMKALLVNRVSDSYGNE